MRSPLLSRLGARAPHRRDPLAVEAHARYRFTLGISGVDLLDDSVFGALAKAGCDDALIGVRCGQSVIEFSREAPSLAVAVMEAARQVRDAVPDLELVSLKLHEDTIGTPGPAAITMGAIAGRAASERRRRSALRRTARRETVAAAVAFNALWHARHYVARVAHPHDAWGTGMLARWKP
jgi:hypothetical protein